MVVVPELVELADLRGVLHNHTTDSDGAASLEEMAAAAADRGWSFFGVADHSPGGVLRQRSRRGEVAGSVGEGRCLERGQPRDCGSSRGWRRISSPMVGSISRRGARSGLDYVVASVHSSFRLTEEAQTERIVAAVRHPACRILGHPTGRLLLARPGYAVDLERVLDACAENGVAVEINASPYRLDLDWRWARRALEQGLKLAINPDAHSIDGLDQRPVGCRGRPPSRRHRGRHRELQDIDEFLER